MAKKILIVEDENDLNKLLKYNLEKEGYQTLVAIDGAEGVNLFEKEKPDLVLLDIMLPKLDGFEFCQIVRRESRTPIIMLTAKSAELDRVLGLELGADDYVTKPFSIRELMARIKAILRRVGVQTPIEKIVRAGDLEVDLERYETRVKKKLVSLSSKEFEFLRCLIQANGRALSRDKLLELVWGYDNSFDIDTRTVDQHIARLRDKLGSEASRIVTVKNVGYKLRFDL